MTGDGIQLDKIRHVLLENGSPIVDMLRRECHDPSRADRLLEYIATDTGRHVVALWIDRDAGIIVELTNWHPVYDPFSHEHVEQVLFNLNDDIRAAGLQCWCEQMLAEERARIRRHWDDEASRHDLREWMRRQEPNLDKRQDPRWLAAV